jgi:tyrosyl-tRNA synthetase
VKLRLEREQPLSFLEFNYMILQAYDFVELARARLPLQMGGSDQWGNIVNGIELGRGREHGSCSADRAAHHHRSGAKMGKTAPARCGSMPTASARTTTGNTGATLEDADVGRFLKLFTDLPLDEIARLEKLQGSEINDAKIVLANEATTLCHGVRRCAHCAGTGDTHVCRAAGRQMIFRC